MGRLSETKGIPKDVVRKKREEEREAVMEEARLGGGYNSTVFWQIAKKINSKAPSYKRLKDKGGKVYDSEEAMAEIAREHFEGIGIG